MSVDLRLLVTEEDTDPERVDRLVGYLRRELRDVDVDDVRPLPGGTPPTGTRAVDLVAVGGVAVTAVRTAETLRSVLDAVWRWLRRGSGGARTARLELGGDVLELRTAGGDEGRQAMDSFVQRHTRGDGFRTDPANQVTTPQCSEDDERLGSARI